MKNKKIWLAITAVIILTGIFAIVSAGKDNTDTAMNMPRTTQSSSANEISIKNYMFGPMSTTVKVGTKVTWTNEDAVVHTVTADTKTDGAPDSMNIAQHGTYSFTFTKAGTYKYHCLPHPYMHATITVKD